MASEWKVRILISKLALEDKTFRKKPTDHLTRKLVCLPHFNKPEKFPQFYMKMKCNTVVSRKRAQYQISAHPIFCFNFLQGSKVPTPLTLRGEDFH